VSRVARCVAFVRQVARSDWSQLTLGAAARLAPAILVTIGAGLLFGDARGGVIATSGALIVGFGMFQQFTSARAAPMLFAAAGGGISIFVGTLAGHATAGLALAALAYGLGCGLLPAINMGAFWIGQQCTVFMLLAGAYFGGMGEAVSRFALVEAGAATQFACYGLYSFLGHGRVARPRFAATLFEARQALAGLGTQVSAQSPLFRFAVRFAVALVAAVVVERVLAIPNGYWVAMTTLLLLRPDFQDTLARSLGRLGGTVLGAAAATAVSDVLRPGVEATAALVAAFAFCCYSTLRLNYGVFSFFLTGYVIFLLALAGLTEAQVASYRVIATLLGGAIALLAHLDFYRARRRRDPANNRAISVI